MNELLWSLEKYFDMRARLKRCLQDEFGKDEVVRQDDVIDARNAFRDALDKYIDARVDSRINMVLRFGNHNQ